MGFAQVRTVYMLLDIDRNCKSHHKDNYTDPDSFSRMDVQPLTDEYIQTTDIGRRVVELVEVINLNIRDNMVNRTSILS